MPRLNGSETTCAPAAAATSAVRSVEPSETTTTSSSLSSAASSPSRRPMLRSSLNAGTTAIRRTAASGPAAVAGAGSTVSSVDMCGDSEVEQLEHPAGTVAVRVLVEHPLARAAPHLRCLGRVVEERLVGRRRFVGVVHDQELAPGLEPALDPLVGVGDDGSAARGELERTARGGAEHGRVRAAGDAQVDPRRRDGARERRERDVADQARGAGVAEEVVTAEREVDVRKRARRLSYERRHPLAPELVAVAVEEDVGLLLDRLRREELRVGAPEDDLGAAGAERPQAVETALGVRDQE